MNYYVIEKHPLAPVNSRHSYTQISLPVYFEHPYTVRKTVFGFVILWQPLDRAVGKQILRAFG